MQPEVLTQEPTPPTAARWEDFVDIFVSPGELFRRRANESWTVPLLVVCGLATLVYFGFPGVNRAFADAQMQDAIARRPELAERMRGSSAGRVQVVIGGVLMPIFMTLGIAMGAFFTWVAAKFTSIVLSWRKALMINAWIAMVGVLNQLAIYVAALLKLNRGESLHVVNDRSVGVLRFLNTDELNPALVGLLTRADPFAVWSLVLMAIALSAAAGAPGSRAWATATMVWLMLALPFIAVAAMR